MLEFLCLKDFRTFAIWWYKFTFSLLFSEYVDLTCYIIMWCLLWFSIALCAALQLIHWLLSWCIVTDAVLLWVNYTPIIQKHCGVSYTFSIQAVQCPILLSLETIAIIQSSTLKPGDDMSELNWSLYISPGEWKKRGFCICTCPLPQCKVSVGAVLLCTRFIWCNCRISTVHSMPWNLCRTMIKAMGQQLSSSYTYYT